MQSLNGVNLTGAALVLVATMGCAGAVSQPQSAKSARKAEPQGTIERSAAAAPSVEKSSFQSANRAEQTLDRDGSGESLSPLSAKEAPGEPKPQRVTALKPPTIRPAVMPEVVLSAAHANDCLVRVGDQFPDFGLSDLDGRARTLSELQRDGLTVVVFWAGDRLAAESQLQYLNEHIVRYADVGVHAVAINIGQTPDQVRAAVDALEVRIPVWLDLDGRLFARIGKDHLPRTYLLGRDGRVLWFDIEFSRHTREYLEQAIHASLKST